MTEKNRYITLQGDPIHTPPIQKALGSVDMTVAGIGTVFTVAAHQALGSGDPSAMLSSIARTITDYVFGSTLTRFFSERVALGYFNESGEQKFYLKKGVLNSICIDTQPEQEASAGSLQKYRRKAILGAVGHGLFLSFNTANILYKASSLITTSLLNGQAPQPEQLDLLHIEMIEITRQALGVKRFNKVAKGEWAIIDMPPVKEIKPAKETNNLKPAYEYVRP